jgi:hypothetical protein
MTPKKNVSFLKYSVLGCKEVSLILSFDSVYSSLFRVLFYYYYYYYYYYLRFWFCFFYFVSKMALLTSLRKKIFYCKCFSLSKSNSNTWICFCYSSKSSRILLPFESKYFLKFTILKDGITDSYS